MALVENATWFVVGDHMPQSRSFVNVKAGALTAPRPVSLMRDAASVPVKVPVLAIGIEPPDDTSNNLVVPSAAKTTMESAVCPDACRRCSSVART